MREKTAAIYTLGCRVNRYESDAIANELCIRGWDVRPFGERCSVYIINTCTVTAESDRKSRQMIRRARSASPDAFVIVCGCYSQVKPGDAASYADLVLGTRNKMKAVLGAEAFYRGEPFRGVDVSDPADCPYEALSAPHTDRTRAFVKIEDGCDGKCAYCLIRKARGPVVSRPEDEIVAELERLYDAGYPEVVFTGIEISAYGRDTGTDLLSLLGRLKDVKHPPRVRLSSVDLAWLRPEVSERLAHIDGMMPHLHLSVQSGSASVLAAMRRRYNAETLYKNVEACRKSIPGVRFSADIIAGFPGESEADHEATLDFLDFADLVHAHIFPFSERAGTEAAVMDGRLDKKTKAERAASLAERQRQIQQRDAERDRGQTVNVLFETTERGYAYGHTDDFRYVRVKTDKNLHAVILPVKLGGYENETYDAKLV